MPTLVGGLYETYSLTIDSPLRCRVKVRTPFAGAVAPSRKCWWRMKGSQRRRTAPVVCETANAVAGSTGTTSEDSTTGMVGWSHGRRPRRAPGRRTESGARARERRDARTARPRRGTGRPDRGAWRQDANAYPASTHWARNASSDAWSFDVLTVSPWTAASKGALIPLRFSWSSGSAKFCTAAMRSRVV